MSTTPTGIPIRPCPTCGLEHVITRKHCTKCGRPSLFISPRTGECITCHKSSGEEFP